jgi:uncharacterized protein
MPWGITDPPAPAPVPSPCVSLCRLDPMGLCLGCRRSIDEIIAWGDMSDADKRAVLAKLDSR